MSASQQWPSAEPVQEPKRMEKMRRRWPWVVGIIAAFFVGIGVGAGGADPESLVDEHPIVAARLAELDERDGELERRAVELAEQEVSGASGVRQREDDAASREKELDSRAAELDERESALDERQADLTAEEDAIAANTVPGSGIFVVGEDIEPGTYKTSGSSLCYYARLRDTSGDFDSIITNANVDGPATVTISSSDGAFETSGCADWVKQ
ncbi:MAG: hypothetical protein ACRDQ7_18370 [Haloechinothrix sp.]